MMEGGFPDLTDTDCDSNSVDQIYEISAMKNLLIGSVKITSIPSRNVSETKAMVQDVPQANTFNSKGSH